MDFEIIAAGLQFPEGPIPMPDGSVILVCADKDPGYGNWIDLSAHRQGTGLWRWIEADEHPVPQCKVVKL